MGWPSSHASGTLGYMLDRIADEIQRADLLAGGQIMVAITDAINTYQRERFRWNETFTTTFLTIGGQQNYSLLSDPNFPAVTSLQQMFVIDWVTITIPPAVFDMPRIQPEEILILTQTGTQMGQPYVYAFANETLMIYPVPPTGTPNTGPVTPPLNLTNMGGGYPPGTYAAIPATHMTGSGVGLTLNLVVNAGGQIISAAIANGGTNYAVGDTVTAVLGQGQGFIATVQAINATGQGPFLITVGGQATYPMPGTLDTTGNRWMIDAERLIRSRAKYELSKHYTRDSKLAEMMSPYAPQQGQPSGEAYDAFEMLKAEVNRLSERGMIRATPF